MFGFLEINIFATNKRVQKHSWSSHTTSFNDNFITALHMGLFQVESSWNVMAHGDAREGRWGGNCQMEWVASTLHTTSEHGVSSITSADAHTSAASSRLNWCPRRFKWIRPFRRKTKSLFLRVCHHISKAVYNEMGKWEKNGNITYQELLFVFSIKYRLIRLSKPQKNKINK